MRDVQTSEIMQDFGALCHALGLGGWRIVLKLRQCEYLEDVGEDVLGHVRHDFEMQKAWVEVARKGKSRKEIRLTLLHELMHVKLAEMDWIARGAANMLDKARGEIIEDEFRIMAERFVHGMEEALSPHLDAMIRRNSR